MRSVRLALRPAPSAQRVFAENYERVPESAASARQLVASALDAWHLPQVADTATLVLTELVSNAVKHAQGEGMRVSVIRINDHCVRVSVIDRDCTRPRVRHQTLDGEGGRGLFMVNAMSAFWGVDLLANGKRVWADVEAL